MNWLLDVIARHRRLAMASIVAEATVAAALVLSSGGHAVSLPPLPTNDLQNLISLTGVPTPAQAPIQTNAEPKLAPVPRALCAAGSRPLLGEQGRVPASAISSPAAADGWTCNTTEVSNVATAGGFRVWRYVDRSHHVCAFYDTSLFSPLNVVSLAGGPSPGVVVLDMSNPAHPIQTAMLTSLPMELPHESLNLNAKRGLLAADMGNGTTYPGLMSIYDVGADCRHPVLDSTFLAARFGHESGFSPDGRTFWVAGGEGIAAVDVSDPKHPHTIWEGNVFAHGLNVSDDGNRLYDAEPIDGNLVILDVSQVQARKPHPVVREISRLTWGPVSVPQNSDPIEINGRPYLLEFDEFAFRFNPVTAADTPGAARIIDISNDAHPRVVSNLRLEVNMPAAHQAADGDPAVLAGPSFTYSGHYCNVPREVDPEIAACSFLNSGLRIFDIRDPLHPREVAYYIAPPKASTLAGAQAADAALSQPAFDPARREVWYTDATSGFYVVKLDKAVWPHPTTVGHLCAPASGRLAGRSLGPATLGRTRASIRGRLKRFSTRGRRTMDFYCLHGGGIRVGYPSGALLRALASSARTRVRGRSVLILSSNPRYRLHGVRPGSRLAPVAHRLHVSRPYRIGRNSWYLVPGGRAEGLLKVRHGVIEEVGIVDRRLIVGHDRHRNRRALASFR